MPKAAEEEKEKKSIPPVEDNSFPVNEEESTEVEAKKADLGPASDTENSPADADAAANEPHPGGDVIPPRNRPAQIEIPAPEEIVPEPQPPEDLKDLEDKPTSAGVAPKVRLVLRGRFGTPSIVRLKLRPNHDWQPTANPPVLAKH